MDIDIAVIVHVEQRLVSVRILSLLLAVRLPDVVLALALEAIGLLLVPSSKVVAAVAGVLVVVVRRLQDRVVLCLQVASVVDGDILVEGVVHIVVLVRYLVLADRAGGHDVLVDSYILNQGGLLPKLRTEAAFLGGACLAASFFNLPFHEVTLLLFHIWRSCRLDKLDESTVAIAVEAQIVQHRCTDVAVGR